MTSTSRRGGCRLDGLRDGGHEVSLSFNGAEKMVVADIVVGADGVRSSVREAMALRTSALRTSALRTLGVMVSLPNPGRLLMAT